MDLFDLAMIRKAAANGGGSGADSGKTVYDHAVEAGFAGTEKEFYEDLTTILSSGFQNEVGLSVVNGKLCMSYNDTP